MSADSLPSDPVSERILARFRERRPLYERLKRATAGLVEQLASQNDIDLFRLESRTKDEESLRDKVYRPDKSGKYKDIGDVTDLCGIRVVLFTNEDCARLSLLLRQQFTVDEANSIDKHAEADADRFGYLSRHIVCSLPHSRTRLFEYKDLKDLKVEIQIRTVLQHAWAVLDWKMRYKSPLDVPAALRRKLFRLSAFLEAADDTFSELQRSSSELLLEYGRDVSAGRTGISLSLESIQAFLRESVVAQRFYDEIRRRGVEVHEPIGAPASAWAYLLASLRESGVSNLDDLERRLAKLTDEQYGMVARIGTLHNAGLGGFTPIRDAILSQLPLDQRKRVLERVPTGFPIQSYELSVFGGE